LITVNPATLVDAPQPSKLVVHLGDKQQSARPVVPAACPIERRTTGNHGHPGARPERL
jgi:hypothetical protein